MRVALFVTCMNNALYPETGRAVVKVLERLGHRVEFPEPQTCCGQMHLNGGYRREGLALAREVMTTFDNAEAIVIPSGSCTATMRHLWSDVAHDEHDDELQQSADAFGQKVFEFSEFLVDVLGVTDVGARFARRVTYHPTCHSLRAIHVGDRPLQLLRAVRDIELTELNDAESCCGFGGLFAIKNAETSVAMGLDKIANVQNSGAEVLCASDNSCLTHVASLLDKTVMHGLKRKRGPALRQAFEVRHLAEILASTGPAA